MPSDLDLTLAPVADALEEMQVRFYVCGSVASSVHGKMRATADIDVVAELKPDDVPRLLAHLKGAYYADDAAMRQAIRSRSSFNLIHQETYLKVDVFASKGRKYDEEVLNRREVKKLGEADDAVEAPVCSIEDVVLAKLEWYRLGGEVSDRQWNDIVGVLQIQHFVVDLYYLDKWARELGISTLLARALDDSGIVEETGN